LVTLNIQRLGPLIEMHPLHDPPSESAYLLFQRTHILGGPNEPHIDRAGYAWNVAMLIQRPKHVCISIKLGFDALRVD